MFDLMNLMGKMKEIQTRIADAQAGLQKISVTGESGGGMVKVTMNGKKEVLTIDIDSALLTTDSKTITQDLVVAAMNKATAEADEVSKEAMKKATEGLLPNIPGFDLGKLMGQ